MGHAASNPEDTQPEVVTRVWNPETRGWTTVPVAAAGVVMEVDGHEGSNLSIGAGANGTLRASIYVGDPSDEEGPDSTRLFRRHRLPSAFSVDVDRVPTDYQVVAAAAELNGDTPHPHEPPMKAVLWQAERSWGSREVQPQLGPEVVPFNGSGCVDVVAPDGRQVQVVFHQDGSVLVRGWSGFYEDIDREEEHRIHTNEMGPGDEVVSMSIVIPRVPEYIQQGRNQRYATSMERRKIIQTEQPTVTP